MWIKRFRILWFKLQREENRHMSFSFPIPLYIFQELFDCILDLLDLACFFVPKMNNSNPSKSISIHAVKELIQLLLNLFDSLAEDEPYDLVDVTANHFKVSIKIK